MVILYKKGDVRMKIFDIWICCFLLLISVIPGYCESYAVRIETKEGENESKLLVVSKDNLETGESEEIIDLHEFGIYKLINYCYDAQRDILIVNNYGSFAIDYNIRIIDLKQKKILKDIILNTPEPNVTIITNPSDNKLYISFWDNNKKLPITRVYDENYNLMNELLNISIDRTKVYSSKDGKYHYLFGYDTVIRKEIFLIVDSEKGTISKKKDLNNIGIKGKYSRIRDGKKGILLIEYRFEKNKKKTETYILYDPFDDKIIDRMDNVPYHVGEVYLDDSLNNIVINDAKFIKVSEKTERKYTNKIMVYSFSKGKKIKEISIKEGTKIGLVKDKIYLKHDNGIKVENIK